jgi:hypothetical protein
MEMPTPDGVQLSAYERHLLAELEARASMQDPLLDARLRRPPWDRALGALGRWWTPALSRRAGPLAIVAGVVLVVAAVSAGVWLSVPAVALLVAGGCGIGSTLKARFLPAGGDSATASPTTTPGA